MKEYFERVVITDDPETHPKYGTRIYVDYYATSLVSTFYLNQPMLGYWWLKPVSPNALAHAWEEGHAAGQHNSEALEAGVMLKTNPYRKETQP